jgi:hypothetical protein
VRDNLVVGHSGKIVQQPKNHQQAFSTITDDHLSAVLNYERLAVFILKPILLIQADTKIQLM